jgi:hypothetical protein
MHYPFALRDLSASAFELVNKRYELRIPFAVHHGYSKSFQVHLTGILPNETAGGGADGLAV